MEHTLALITELCNAGLIMLWKPHCLFWHAVRDILIFTNTRATGNIKVR